MLTNSFRSPAIFAILLVALVGAHSEALNDEAFVKPSGWDIGTLRLLKTKSQWQRRVGATNVNVSVLLVPEEGILFEDTACYLNTNGRRRLHPSPMNASYASRFDVNGHIFCYTVRGPGVAITEISPTEKRVGALGCESFFAFYDNDGDGKFETLVPLATVGALDLHVPSWALH